MRIKPTKSAIDYIAAELDWTEDQVRNLIEDPKTEIDIYDKGQVLHMLTLQNEDYRTPALAIYERELEP